MKERYYLSYVAKGITVGVVEDALAVALEVAQALTPKVDLSDERHANGVRVFCKKAQFLFVQPEMIDQLYEQDRKRFLDGKSGILEGLNPQGVGQGTIRTDGLLHDAPFRALLTYIAGRAPAQFVVDCSLETPADKLWRHEEVLKDFDWYPQMEAIRPALARAGLMGRIAQIESQMTADRPNGLLGF